MTDREAVARALDEALRIGDMAKKAYENGESFLVWKHCESVIANVKKARRQFAAMGEREFVPPDHAPWQVGEREVTTNE